ncbi:Coagulation factor VIII [Stylophora pistillata]|uniref:Coagulation factor VIII n=1 Tax=Stylophora pistillata TaxID=50429 RepID=A0A2B4SZA3_STYPI|nr:Coagulation factor VIII [Stylophora pistillata]
MSTGSVYQLALCLMISVKVHAAGAAPELDMDTGFVNETKEMNHGDHFGYVTTLKHADTSNADAKGIHVTWMLAPYIKYRHLVDISLGIDPPQVTQKDDSVTLKIGTLSWGMAATISFKVQFDPEMILKPKYYDIVTPVQLLYYDDYKEDNGVVTKKNLHSLLNKVSFDVELPGCSQPLGMKSGKINDYQITASSSYDESQPSRARETEDAWCTDKEDKDQYIQVDFLLKTRVTRMGTMRRKTKDHWVSEYFLQYSNDDITWHDYLENGQVKGCDIPGSPANCISPLGLESGEITDAALTHSLPSNSDTKPEYIRLHNNVKNFPYGWYPSSPDDYLQIDFGSLRRVTRMSTMGGTYSFFYVKLYELKYSLDGMTWVDYREKLNGPKSNKEAVYAVLAKLAEPFVARYLRIFHDAKGGAMRAEVYGCFAEELPPYDGVSMYARRSFLLDPVTDRFYVCMYTSELIESSCFSTTDGVEWIAVQPFIISVTASNPSLKEIYGLDRRMNFHRSRDSGESWRQITDGYFNKTLTETQLIKAKALPENLVSEIPTGELTAVANSTGTTWGVSGHGIHVMTAGSKAWSLVGTWKCCGQ